MFYSYNPVKLIHGSGSLKRAASEIPTGAQLTVLHGASHLSYPEAIKIISAWPSTATKYIRAPSHEPTLASIELILNQIPCETNFIVGIGGGSVMDTTKAVAACFGNKITPRELNFSSSTALQNTTQFGLVSTRPGSGSELNNSFVLTDEQTKVKEPLI